MKVDVKKTGRPRVPQPSKIGGAVRAGMGEWAQGVKVGTQARLPGSKADRNIGYDLRGGSGNVGRTSAAFRARFVAGFLEKGTKSHVVAARGRYRRSRGVTDPAQLLRRRSGSGAKAVKTPFGPRAWAKPRPIRARGYLRKEIVRQERRGTELIAREVNKTLLGAARDVL